MPASASSRVFENALRRAPCQNLKLKQTSVQCPIISIISMPTVWCLIVSFSKLSALTRCFGRSLLVLGLVDQCLEFVVAYGVEVLGHSETIWREPRATVGRLVPQKDVALRVTRAADVTKAVTPAVSKRHKPPSADRCESAGLMGTASTSILESEEDAHNHLQP